MSYFGREHMFLVVAISLAGALALGRPAGAAAQSASDSSYAPISYWGEFSPPSDSTQAVFRDHGRAAWEWPLFVPYSVIALPLRGLRLGMGAGIRWADRADLFRFLNIVPVPRGAVPSFDYSSQAGFTFGLNYYIGIGSPKNPLRARAGYSTAQWQRYTIGAMLNRGGKWEMQLGAGYRVRPNLRFYGIGPQTRVADLSFYEDERNWAGAIVRRRIGRRSFIGVLAAFSSVTTRLPSAGHEPTLPEKFPDVISAPGFNRRSEGVMVRIGANLNGTKKASNPGRGTIIGATAGVFQSTNQDDVSFIAYRSEFQQFIPLWHTKRTLAVRAYLNWLDNTGSIDIPFQRLFINEAPDQFRGYTGARWRDRGITGLTLEYRFPFMADDLENAFGIDTALLLDVGQVFRRVENIAINDLTYSYGVGWRAYLDPHFVGTMELMWSDEGFQFRLSTQQLFQFSKDVLYNGKEETVIH